MTILLVCCFKSHANNSYYFAGQLLDASGEDLSTEIGYAGVSKSNNLVNVSNLNFTHSDDDYLTLNMGYHYATGDWLKAYIGYGGFFGTNKIQPGHKSSNCDDNETRTVKCPEPPNYIFGIYPEIGGMILLGRIKAGIYGRYVYVVDQNPNEYAVAGINIGIDF